MSKKEKLEAKLLSLSRSLTWQELCSILQRLGFDIDKGKGSKRQFNHPEKDKAVISLHEPHPERTVKVCYQKQVIAMLKESELL